MSSAPALLRGLDYCRDVGPRYLASPHCRGLRSQSRLRRFGVYGDALEAMRREVVVLNEAIPLAARPEDIRNPYWIASTLETIRLSTHPAELFEAIKIFELALISWAYDFIGPPENSDGALS